MGTLQEKALYALDTRKMLMEALRERGLDVPDDLPFRAYIDMIPSAVAAENSYAAGIGYFKFSVVDGRLLMHYDDNDVVPNFKLTEDKHLVLQYPDGKEPPPFYIDADGHLIYPFND